MKQSIFFFFLAINMGDLGLIPGLGRPLEEEKATHSNIFAWRILRHD
jgi:hypothetical protein